jgi:hypothetical protein
MTSLPVFKRALLRNIRVIVHKTEAQVCKLILVYLISSLETKVLNNSTFPKKTIQYLCLGLKNTYLFG